MHVRSSKETYHLEISFSCALIKNLSLLKGHSLSLSKCHVDVNDSRYGLIH